MRVKSVKFLNNFNILCVKIFRTHFFVNYFTSIHSFYKRLKIFNLNFSINFYLKKI